LIEKKISCLEDSESDAGQSSFVLDQVGRREHVEPPVVDSTDYLKKNIVDKS
jgi:hypothetical protein